MYLSGENEMKLETWFYAEGAGGFGKLILEVPDDIEKYLENDDGVSSSSQDNWPSARRKYVIGIIDRYLKSKGIVYKKPLSIITCKKLFADETLV